MEQRTIDLVHSAFCKLNHAHEPEDLVAKRKPKTCYYYLEGQIEHGENMKDHKAWAKRAQEIADQMAFTSDEEMIKLIENLGKIVGGIALLKYTYPGSEKLLAELMEKF